MPPAAAVADTVAPTDTKEDPYANGQCGQLRVEPASALDSLLTSTDPRAVETRTAMAKRAVCGWYLL